MCNKLYAFPSKKKKKKKKKGFFFLEDREEAVGLKSSNYTWKIRFLWIYEIWGNFAEIWYFAKNFLIKVRV